MLFLLRKIGVENPNWFEWTKEAGGKGLCFDCDLKTAWLC